MKEERLTHASQAVYKNDWETPPEIFEPLQEEFGFTLDPCCSVVTAKAQKFYTPADDGLAQDWENETVFVNPPYGRQLSLWVQKAHEAWRSGATVVLLIPASVDTRWFHDYLYPHAEIRFLKGRVRFWTDGSPADKKAPFPTMVAVLRQENTDGQE